MEAERVPERARSNLSRIVAILSSFDVANTPRASAEILQEAGINRATGFALIRSLIAESWLERVDHGLLKLGTRAVELMFCPLEPGLALTERPASNMIPLRIGPPRISLDAFTDDGSCSDLTESVTTTQYRIDRPARIGFSNASLSNAWRRGLLDSMEYARNLKGDRIASLTTLSADDDPDRQVDQINALVAEGIDVLIVSCVNVNSLALNDRLAELAGEGLPVVALDRRPKDGSCLTCFVTASDTRIGRVMAQWMVERLAPGARSWMLSGIDGTSPAIRRQSAALSVFTSASDITVEAVTFTDWTEAGGRAAIDRLLDQCGRVPDGVWCDSGLQGVGSIRRFVELGKAVPAHTGGDLNGMYKLALDRRVPFVAVDYPAAMGARAIDVALDILAGKSVRRRIEVAAPVVMPRGVETPGVRADIWAETHVRWDLPDDAILSQGPSLRGRADAKRSQKENR